MIYCQRRFIVPFFSSCFRKGDDKVTIPTQAAFSHPADMLPPREKTEENGGGKPPSLQDTVSYDGSSTRCREGTCPFRQETPRYPPTLGESATAWTPACRGWRQPIAGPGSSRQTPRITSGAFAAVSPLSGAPGCNAVCRAIMLSADTSDCGCSPPRRGSLPL